ncbi:nitronate monooxygenase [Halocella sp. SP3-1]|uniref:NAD(P)H-dependent flavin oxidoreductase n=1 Tax=Halocella sp. SP3-1 TaxID=2382161 RepID=UPI000F759F71|nr:nitronate monooxygenase [Halocella sp. SP3-1]AZO93925.1 nitronate monooxygenase [Halocella sp. SP3-1]MTI59187.1 nitronate monooxygenase [Bacillota bacterium]
MNFPKLKIGRLKPDYPIIQGGMAIKVSMAKLASAVANEGGIGVIGGSALSIDELKTEITRARQLTDGILGVNIMYAFTGFLDLLKSSIESGIDLVISGAGFSRDMFAIGEKHNVPIVPIVSSMKLARISEKLGAAAVVVEGGNAGGHLGTDKDSWDIVKKIKEKLSIPVIAAGDIVSNDDIKKMFDKGLDGVQMGTRFLATLESDVSDFFKELLVKAKESDVITIMSSAGFPANAIKSKFSELILNNQAPAPENCTNCLKHCNKKFCIKEALIRARNGDQNRGVFFTGKGIEKIKDIISVKEVFKSIKE